jgi:AhpC/TSA family protein
MGGVRSQERGGTRGQGKNETYEVRGTNYRAALTGAGGPPMIRSAMPVDSETVPVGAAAPDFTLTAIDGRAVTLSSLRGKPVVVVFLRGFM